MKKKGLIVATIVMVLVLAASITTATYAWFTATGAATVSQINFSVTAASDLVIGVAKDNAFITTTPAWSDFVSDATEYTAATNKWTGDTDGLGLSINTGLDLSGMTKGVYSFENVTGTETVTAASPTAYTKGVGTAVTTGFDRSKTALKAAGSGTTVSDDSWEFAIKNDDYLDVSFAVAAAKNNVLNFGCLISIDNLKSISSLGMNAAIHAIYSTDGTNYTEVDIYGDKTNADANGSVTAPTLPSETINGKALTYESQYITGANAYEAGDANLWIPLRTVTSETNYATTGAAGIQQIHLIIYICGPDSDCITAATGTGATISIEFLSLNKTAWDNAAV